MMLSLNEVGSTVLKAGRGAGLPLGVAEDLSQIAVYLMGVNGPAACITQALTEPKITPRLTWTRDCLQIAEAGSAISAVVIRDAFAMGYDKARLAVTSHAPLVCAALAAKGVALCWDGPLLWRSDTTVIQPRCAPVQVPQQDWQVWCDLAARTLVPQSEASRNAGAGAGLIDND